MTPNEVALTAALGASALTAFASLGVIWIQEWLRGRASDTDALHVAMNSVLTRSLAVGMRAQALGQMMRLRSGLVEGFEVAARQRKPVDPLELHDWMAQEIAPLNAAQMEIWARADQEGVRLANDVVGRCMDLLGANIAQSPTRNGWERIRKWAVGERWTTEIQEEHERALRELAASRKHFAEYARHSLGRRAVDVFAQVQADPGPVLPNQLPSTFTSPSPDEATTA
ncbi:hypothetical protein ACIO1C_34550 [Streptomyces sp. NPDC087420]|uniref:hypothetical protein n=1 Tax=Streptomyces sp. NPDC087420 TaxID=3365785 RepID=UPI003838A33E